eukprot:1362720-Amphidinium_carterae.3
MLQHWRCRQRAGQPGISRCSTIGAEKEAMAHYWSPVFQTVPTVDESAWYDYLGLAPRLHWPAIPLDESVATSHSGLCCNRSWT